MDFLDFRLAAASLYMPAASIDGSAEKSAAKLKEEKAESRKTEARRRFIPSLGIHSRNDGQIYSLR